MRKYNRAWITLCKNEIDILPFARQYWERLECDVYVYDNHSTDGSIEYLQQIPYVTLRTFDSDGQNDIIQKHVKENAYLELRDSYDTIIISDMDELFYFNNFDDVENIMHDNNYDCLITPIHSLCEESKPIPTDGKLLHELCHLFYKQRMNHMTGFDNYSKISIFNANSVKHVNMSVGQHFVRTEPTMAIMLSNDGFCLHIDKGFGIDYKYNARQRMNANLSNTNRMGGMCHEYGKTYAEVEAEYIENIKNSYNVISIKN